VARIYADEDFDYDVVRELRLLGHDVLTVQEAGKGGRGFGDPLVLADAVALGRAVVTFNRRHFKRLARITPSHFGIIHCTRDDDVVALAQRIDRAIRAVVDLTNQVIGIVKPHSP
jgi:hypothetical protein